MGALVLFQRGLFTLLHHQKSDGKDGKEIFMVLAFEKVRRGTRHRCTVNVVELKLSPAPLVTLLTGL